MPAAGRGKSFQGQSLRRRLVYGPAPCRKLLRWEHTLPRSTLRECRRSCNRDIIISVGVGPILLGARRPSRIPRAILCRLHPICKLKAGIYCLPGELPELSQPLRRGRQRRAALLEELCDDLLREVALACLYLSSCSARTDPTSLMSDLCEGNTCTTFVRRLILWLVRSCRLLVRRRFQ